ncbi:MAG: hypothetical protein ABH877_00345 [bacterium]
MTTTLPVGLTVVEVGWGAEVVVVMLAVVVTRSVVTTVAPAVAPAVVETGAAVAPLVVVTEEVVPPADIPAAAEPKVDEVAGPAPPGTLSARSPEV